MAMALPFQRVSICSLSVNRNFLKIKNKNKNTFPGHGLTRGNKIYHRIGSI
jgi:hypothetical protein